MREGDPQLSDRDYRAHHGRPQTNQKKCTRSHSNNMWHYEPWLKGFSNELDPEVEERTPCYEALQKKTCAWPTVCKRRE